MAKKKLVIIESNYDRVRDSEGDFIRHFSDLADVQIITDVAFADSYFQMAPGIDVVVTDREGYEKYSRYFGSASVFLTVPEVEVGAEYPDDVTVIVRFMPNEEVFPKIENALRLERIQKPEDGEGGHDTRIITVYSPIGGCGKSLISVGLAKKLRKLDQKVLLVSCDLTQSASIYFPTDRYADENLAEKLKNPDEDTYWTILRNVERDDISYLLPFEQLPDMLDVGMKEWNVLVNILVGKKDFDYIVLDMGSVLNKDAADLMAKAQDLVLVTESNGMAAKKMQKLLKNTNILPKCECILVSDEHCKDAQRITNNALFGTLAPYDTWEEAMEDPLFYRIALKISE